MSIAPLKPYPWQRIPRLVLRIRYGQADLAHAQLDELLDEFDQEHDAQLSARKLRCAMVMSYCLRGGRLGGAAGERIIDENLAAVTTLARKRSWGALRLFMHEYLAQVLRLVLPVGQSRLKLLMTRMQRDLLEQPGRAKSLRAYARLAAV